ncbi:MAG TPA: thioredoxin domain-containing protein, partial [Candidatus Polarisedimenticolia bacterium]|nr:thioredoxin domain-containing protein [Candidatus Polarisedimenticolia bacterium]
RLITRPKDVQDNAVPSGGAMATFVLLRLHALTGEARYRTAADAAIAGVAPLAARYPTAFAKWLTAIDFALADVVEIAIVGHPADPATQELLAASDLAVDLRVLAVAADPAGSVVPLLADRIAIDGRPTAYVCRGFACQMPVTSADALRGQLEPRVAAPVSE